MQIIKRMPIPTYGIECQECGSVIHFRAAESQRDKITCPVCGVTVWTMNALKLEGHADPSGEPEPRGVPCFTNGDKIRAMTDKQLAAYLGQDTVCGTIQEEDGGEWCSQYGSCSECILRWLRQEAHHEP